MKKVIEFGCILQKFVCVAYACSVCWLILKVLISGDLE